MIFPHRLINRTISIQQDRLHLQKWLDPVVIMRLTNFVIHTLPTMYYSYTYTPSVCSVLIICHQMINMGIPSSEPTRYLATTTHFNQEVSKFIFEQ